MPPRSADQRVRDEAHMARCLELAERYRGRTSPNPIVGCVIVDRRGRVIAEGAHRGPGTAHAEVVALRKLGRRAPGATLYVNLEPCNHHGRTPPCAPAVREAGVARVVIGMLDPVADHAGGVSVLRKAKIAVTTGVLRAACERANRPFVTWARLGRPAFTLKAAMTLDGKIATVAGESKWITGEAARADVMHLRDTHDAVMVGIGTVLADDPQLTARRPRARDPHRIVIDRQLRTPLDARLLARTGHVRVIVVAGPDATPERERALSERGAEVWRVPVLPDGRLELAPMARRLAIEGISSVLVEGGAELHASLLDAQLADRIVLYVAPKIVGGPAKSWVGGQGIAALADAYQLELEGPPVRLGSDLRLDLAPARPQPPTPPRPRSRRR